jgi:subtilisin family serine protease
MKRITGSITKLAFILLMVIIVLPLGQAWAIIIKGYYADGKDALLEYSDEIVTVKFKKDTATQQMQEIALKYSVVLIPDSLLTRLLPDFKKMRVPAGQPRDRFIKELLQEASVGYVTPLCFMEDGEYILTNKIFVRFKPGVTEQEIEAFNSQHPVTVIHKYQRLDGGYRYHLRINLDSPLNAVDLLNLYYDAPIVEHASPGLVLLQDPLCGTTPNDNIFNWSWEPQWSLHNTGLNDHINPPAEYDTDIDALEAWDYETGDSSVVIAIIDTGVDLTHEDLQANLWKNTDEIPNNGSDDDNNGYIDDYDGWDFENNNNDPNPKYPSEKYPYGDPHGTRVAGVAAAVTNNTIGIAGVAWHCKIMPLVYSYLQEETADAIDYAVANGARVINMSFRWRTSTPSSDLQVAVNNALAQGVVVVCASGNENESDQAQHVYPADFSAEIGSPIPDAPNDFSGILKVGATIQTDKRWVNPDPYAPWDKKGSNYGLHLDVVAPTGVPTTDIMGHGCDMLNYCSKVDFTSIAAPHVAGLSALVLSANPNLTNGEVKNIIELTADDEVGAGDPNGNDTPGWDQYYGWGRINAYKALFRAKGYGHIITDVTWYNDIELIGDVIVDPGVTLTIKPGVVVTFLANSDAAGGGANNSKAELIVEGKMIADGADSDRIIFQSSIGGSSIDDWYGIVFASGSSDDSILNNCIVNNAYIGVDCSASPTIKNCHISYNSYAGIRCSGNSQAVITNTEITNNGNGSSVGGVSIEGEDAQPNLGTYPDYNGGNTFSSNSPYDIANYTSNVIYAQGNYWLHADYLKSVSQKEIDKNRIYDDYESQGQYGKVKFWPVLDPNDGSTVNVFYGDVNRNREITGGDATGDATMVSQYVVGLIEFDEDQKVRADVTGNGRITGGDAAVISQYVVGMIDHFPVELIPAAPSDKTDEKVYIVRIADGFANGDKIQVPIMVDNAAGVFSGQFEIRYDAELIKGINVVKGTLFCFPMNFFNSTFYQAVSSSSSVD